MYGVMQILQIAVTEPNNMCVCTVVVHTGMRNEIGNENVRNGEWVRA